MELSHNARAFSIESLLSTSYEIDKDDRDPVRHRSAEINSHSSGPKPPGTESVGTESSGPAGPGEPLLFVPTDYSLVHRTASVLRGISMHKGADEGMADYHSPSSPPPVPRQGVPLTNLNIIDQRPVRPKVQSTGYVYPEEGIPGSGSKQKAWAGRYPDESHGAPSGRRFHLGVDYMLTDPPCPVQHPSIKDADLASARDRGNTAAGAPQTVDQPISKCVDGIRVTLENSTLWKMFNKCGTEMIVNRIGRRMFPCVVVKLTGMDPMALYRVQMELNASDRCRYKFISGKWVAVGRADAEHPNALFEPSGSPSSGAFWMQDRVSFAKLKITNNKENGGTNTVLHSMHRYTPRIIITKLKRSSPVNARGIAAPCSDTNLPTESGVPHHRQLAPGGVDVGVGSRPSCFEFEETAFIAVTAYHSEQITQLKIHNNPFAKAFRDADVTAMLQNSYVQSEHNDSTIASTCRRGLIPSMQPWSRTASMEWHRPTSSNTFQNQLDPNVAEFYPSSPIDTQYWRGRGPVNVSEFPDAPWSFDNVAALRPSGIYAHAAARDHAEASSRGLHGLPQYRSHPDMIFDTLSKSRVASLGRHRHSTGEFQQDAFQLAKVNRSLSHPELKLERASTSQVAPPTPRVISKFPELRQAVTDNTRVHHPLRRGVSSTAVNRAAKRHSLPYFSSKKAVYIPRYGSADKATFEKSHDQYADVPRRHSIVSGLPFFRASTGNLFSKMEAEHPAIGGPRVVLSPTSKVAGL